MPGGWGTARETVLESPPEPDTETGTVSRDGIVLPGWGGAEAVLGQPLIVAAGRASKDGEGGGGGKLCGLCLSNPSLYTCPRCNVGYCGLACYRGEAHSGCSEEFYKECVYQQLRTLGREGEVEEEGKRRMQEILLRLRQEQEGGDEAEGDADGDAEGEVEAGLAERFCGLDLDALSEEQLWELLPPQDKMRFEGLLRESEGMREGEGAATESGRSPERGGGEGQGRRQRKKTNKEKDEEKKKRGKTVCQIPAISPRIPPLRSLTSDPCPLAANSLVSALFGYTFALRLYNGDLSDLEVLPEFCQAVLSTSVGLADGRGFGSVEEAVGAVLGAVWMGPYFDRQDPQAPLRAVLDVAMVLEGRGGRYTLAALSQLRWAFGQVRKALPRGEGEGRRKGKMDRSRGEGEERAGGGERQEGDEEGGGERLAGQGERGKEQVPEGEGALGWRQCFLAGKKVEFLQAWAQEYAPLLSGLGGGVRGEHRRQARGQRGAQQAREQLESHWGGKRPPPRRELIQEMD
ncbi:ZNHI2 protein, partial [Amia calva]|nr:ZNHI2 protein [Amia calva]